MITAAPLRQYLAENGIDVSQLSTVTGLKVPELTRFCNDRCITRARLDVLCRTLRLQPHQVIAYRSECSFCVNLTGYRFCPECGRRL